MSGAVDRARRARSLLERLGSRIPGLSGYLDRELRREVDELLRRHVADRLDVARRQVATRVAALTLRESTKVTQLNALAMRLDSLAQRLRAAGAGYAGLFDAFKVKEEQLEQLYAVDLDLAETAEELVAVMEGRKEGWEGEAERLAERLRQAIEARLGVVRDVLNAGRSA